MTPRDRRALLLGLAAVASAVIAFRVVPAGVRAALAWRGRVAQRQATLVWERALAEKLPGLRDSLGRALVQVVALAPHLAGVGTPAEVSANLASLVLLAAGRHALKVVRLDPLPDSAAGVFERVAVHAELEGDIRGLAGLLRALESGDPVLTVCALTVDAPQPVTPRNVSETLHITLTVSGYAMRKVG